jgi:hypothetical protein
MPHRTCKKQKHVYIEWEVKPETKRPTSFINATRSSRVFMRLSCAPESHGSVSLREGTQYTAEPTRYGLASKMIQGEEQNGDCKTEKARDP